VLEPVPELSSGASAGNRVIEGDNLQVMVSLRSQYQGAIDVAYLDPPYNTGKKDFAYSDRRFHDPNADADDMVYVSNEDGGRHTKWLNYMGPRLWLVWQLLAEHGVCLISINDIELFRLGQLMDEIFGEKNRIGVIVWKQAVDNNPTRIAIEHEYVLCYAKRVESVPEHWKGVHPAKEWLLDTYERLKGEETDPKKIEKAYRTALREQRAAHRLATAEGRGDEVVHLGRMDRYRHIDDRGPWAKDWHLENPKKGGYVYDIPHPQTGRPVRQPPRGYRYPPESMQRLLDNDLIVFGKDESEPAQLRRYLKDAGTALRSVVTIPARNGSDTLNALIPDGADRYRHPKPVELMTLLLDAVGDLDALVLDPFAGSGTTGHAVMRINARDGGVRRFILIEEGSREEPYCRTLTSPRLQAASEQERLPGGFIFETVGRRLDRDAIVDLEREAIANLVIQTDATGKGRGIKRLDGDYLIGSKLPHSRNRGPLDRRGTGRAGFCSRRTAAIRARLPHCRTCIGVSSQLLGGSPRDAVCADRGHRGPPQPWCPGEGSADSSGHRNVLGREAPPTRALDQLGVGRRCGRGWPGRRFAALAYGSLRFAAAVSVSFPSTTSRALRFSPSGLSSSVVMSVSRDVDREGGADGKSSERVSCLRRSTESPGRRRR